ncbi:inorganic pyrophosphatase 2 isoform X2 [Beta vulgaris subsp. vulgaris]|uniref:inorganic pyrophosphatase 2 isoform X1 n=1 Tax=Beta vulgaris subsp. vulgaris TaxID=3555 RepID=UPI0020367FE2|nr:inorganic pyrophosphatase 2 isoform X1 [Beta vulgaris subsp. vulgaris]XP_048492397.1 inorganic pyrophosphatase 2 isoform X2 [Beta vulgaris subsp. vulgaris]
MEGIVVVFDFDKTIIDCDSDNWVVDELGFTDLFNQLLNTMPWNSMMDVLMKEMHEEGITIDDIADVLKRIPIHPRIVPAIRAAHAAGCDLRIVSDANLFFIETILEHLGLSDYFSEINTNPGYVDEEGRLRILPHHDFTKSSHGCTNPCPPNMCKGMVIKRLLCKHGNKKFIYLGDGLGDYCPSLRLREGDYVMPRKNFPVWDLISNNPELITSKIHEWTNGEDFERVLLSLIQAIISNADDNDAAHFFNRDCKFESLPISSHDTLPQALGVGPQKCCIVHPHISRSASFGISYKNKIPKGSRGGKTSGPNQLKNLLTARLQSNSRISHGF